MKDRIIKSMFVFIFTGLLFFPLIQFSFEIIPRKSLNGFTIPPKPSPALDTLINGKFQTAYETWFHRKHGLWGYLVRFNNQLNFEVFRQISSGYRSSVLVGKEGFLFENAYLPDYNRILSIDNVIDHVGDRLKLLSELLEKKNKKLIVLYSASKIEVHPEYLQDRFLISGRENRQNNLSRMIDRLEGSGVRVINSYEYFKNLVRPFELVYFNKSGAHWNERGACLITSHLVEVLSNELKNNLQNFSCTSLVERPVPVEYDLDIVKIANLWSESKYLVPVLAPRTENVAIENVHRPKIMLVGTSFVWPMLKYLRKHKVFDNSYFYYYFKRRVSLDNNKELRFGKEFDGWKNDLNNSEAVVIEINQSAVHNTGFQFVDLAINYLSAESPPDLLD
ncbi:MAG TPA: hypothetical protein PKA63_05550 [Oligoflexia bacterium]|nr:hypothetical protein [Oligoflexia bacterium]HMP48114.1 hypothetical protein [Oligoflexia bacterium]